MSGEGNGADSDFTPEPYSDSVNHNEVIAPALLTLCHTLNNLEHKVRVVYLKLIVPGQRGISDEDRRDLSGDLAKAGRGFADAAYMISPETSKATP